MVPGADCSASKLCNGLVPDAMGTMDILLVKFFAWVKDDACVAMGSADCSASKLCNGVPDVMDTMDCRPVPKFFAWAKDDTCVAMGSADCGDEGSVATEPACSNGMMVNFFFKFGGGSEEDDTT